MDNQGLTIPHDTPAEQAVLGSIIFDNKTINDVSGILKPNSFHEENHQHIYRAMMGLVEANQPIDEILIGDQLKSLNKLDDIGGLSYLAELVECAPSSGNIVYYARIIEEYALLRDLITTTTDIGRKSRDPQQSISGLLAEAEDKITEIATRSSIKKYKPLKNILVKSFEKLEEYSRKTSEITGLPTGFIGLDRITSGLQPSDLIILAARPSAGKTALALNIASYVATRGETKGAVLIFSLEMSEEQCSMRMLAAEAQINSKKLRSGKLEQDDWDKLARATDRLSVAPIYINDASELTPYEVMTIARQVNNDFEHGVSMIIVDYIQLMKGNKQTNSREQEIAEISRSMKAIAKELNVPVIALSQLNRALENRSDKRPQISDLRESGSIEQDADIILFIYRDEMYNKDSEKKGTAEIEIAKHRSGPTGMVELVFVGKYTKFASMAKMQPPAF